MINKLPFVSIVIARKNEERNIGHCLKSIKLQTYPRAKIEIIVVDNQSTDKTKEIARKYAHKVFNLPEFLNLTKVKNYRGAQVNFGVKRSKSEIIFFPDADMTFDKELIDEAVKLIKEGQLDALYSPEIIVGRGWLGKIRNFERSFYNTTCIEAVRIMRKKLFFKIDGFDEKKIDFGPDDWDFTKRLKMVTDKISIINSKIYHHEEKMNLREYLTKKRKYSTTFAKYIEKWGKDDQDVKRQLGFWYRYFGVFIENGKWKKLFRHPILTIGMYFLRIMVGANFLISSLKKERNKQTPSLNEGMA